MTDGTYGANLWRSGLDGAFGDVPIPIEELPPIPPSVPIAGPVIQFIGNGEHALWNDVWGWVKSGSKAAVDGAQRLEATVIPAVVNVVETYVALQLQAISGFINDAFDFTEYLSGILGDGLGSLSTAVTDVYRNLAIDIYGVLGDVVGIDARINEVVIPDIYNLGIDAALNVDRAIANVQGWAIDTIYSPLDALVRQVEVAIPVWSVGALDDAKAYADQLVHSETAKIAAAIAAATAAAAIATEWIDDCGEPMCQSIGPKTDLGKLLKGLSLAADALLLAELANLNEDRLVALLRSIAAKGASLVSLFEDDFVAGNETIGGLITHAIASAI